MPLARRVGVIVGPESAWTPGMVQDYQGRLGLTLLPVSSVEVLGDRLRERLADFKRPQRYVPVSALPRTETGKVKKHELPG